MPLSFNLDRNEKDFLLAQARRSIETALSGDAPARPSQPDAPSASPLFRDLGSFVTLSRKHSLRGCIGTIIGREPLWRNVWNMARAAAFQDPRFPPLASDEWQGLDMEISVLDEPAPCTDPSQIEIGRDGLILQYGGRSGIFLPQVPVEQGWNREEYLNHLCLKAGVAPGSWKLPDARLFWYQALVFGEKEED